MKPYHVNLHIDRLVLHDFDEVDRAALGATVERELTRLFHEQGVTGALERGCNVERTRGAPFTAQPNASADALGTQIARSIYGGLSQ